MTRKNFDTIIIGGSIAGLSAALTLCRSIKKVAIFDTANPCNYNVAQSYNFATNDGQNPAEIRRKTRLEIEKYNSAEFFLDEVTSVLPASTGFKVQTKSLGIFEATRILIATGLKDILPDIPGLSECWGKSVFSCPYCHGYEARNHTTAVYAKGDAAHDLSILLTNWSQDLVVVTNGKSELTPQQYQDLKRRNIQIVESPIVSVTHNEGNLSRINFSDGTYLEVPYMYASIPFEQKSTIAQNLNLKFTDSGHIEVDSVFHTSMPNVYAAGDCTAQQRALSVAAASGTTAGFTINQDFVDEFHNKLLKN